MITMATNAALDISIAVTSQSREMEIGVSHRRKYMTLSVEKSTTPLPDYEGPYEVESKLYYGQIFQTKDKRMAANMIVNPVSIQSVSNPQGGRTVTIGSI